jgi:hypothetical protein
LIFVCSRLDAPDPNKNQTTNENWNLPLELGHTKIQFNWSKENLQGRKIALEWHHNFLSLDFFFFENVYLFGKKVSKFWWDGDMHEQRGALIWPDWFFSFSIFAKLCSEHGQSTKSFHLTRLLVVARSSCVSNYSSQIPVKFIFIWKFGLQSLTRVQNRPKNSLVGTGPGSISYRLSFKPPQSVNPMKNKTLDGKTGNNDFSRIRTLKKIQQK